MGPCAMAIAYSASMNPTATVPTVPTVSPMVHSHKVLVVTVRILTCPL